MGWVSVQSIGTEVPVLLPDLEDMSGRNRNMVSKQNKSNQIIVSKQDDKLPGSF